MCVCVCVINLAVDCPSFISFPCMFLLSLRWLFFRGNRRATEEGNDSALKPDTSTELTMDEALNLVGDFGPAQWRVCIFACSCWVPLAMHAIAASFFKADMVSAGLWGMHEVCSMP